MSSRPKFKKGDVIVHVMTGIEREVFATRKDESETYNILIQRHVGGREWMNSQYYELKSIFDSPLYQALR